ncbi:oxidoreductase [Streptosporangium canum]|uniref:oxidoreductase n=1 Tax=Streptosporangium canum TaxID=324952 RepID=UPI0037BC6A06
MYRRSSRPWLPRYHPPSCPAHRSRLNALVIDHTEGIQPSLIGQSNPGTPGLHTDAQVAAWRPVTDAVHTNGGRIFAQIMHAGRVSHPDTTGTRPMGPSAAPAVGQVFTLAGPKPAPCRRRWTPRRRAGVHPGRAQAGPVPQALDTAEVPEHARSYAEAARRAFIANPDLVERLRQGLPITPHDESTWYEGGDAGYLTYTAYRHTA